MLQRHYGVTGDVSWQVVTCHQVRKSCSIYIMDKIISCDMTWNEVILKRRHGVAVDVSCQVVKCHDTRRSCCSNVMELLVMCHDKLWCVMTQAGHAAATSWCYWWCVMLMVTYHDGRKVINSFTEINQEYWLMIILLVFFWQMTTAHDIIFIHSSGGASGQQYLYPLAIDFSLQLVGSSSNFSPRPNLEGRGHKVALLLLDIHNFFLYCFFFNKFSHLYFLANTKSVSAIFVTLMILLSVNMAALMKMKIVIPFESWIFHISVTKFKSIQVNLLLTPYVKKLRGNQLKENVEQGSWFSEDQFSTIFKLQIILVIFFFFLLQF